MSDFDENQFAAVTSDSELSTTYTAIPEDDYDLVVNDRPKFRAYDGTPIIDVPFKLVNCEEMKAKYGLREPTVNQSYFIELDGSRVANGPNKNVKLGQLLEACGVPANWRLLDLPDLLNGKGPIRGRVTQVRDKEDSGQVYNRVTRVAKLR